MKKQQLGLGISGRAKIEVIDGSGAVVRSLGWTKNLLTETGLENLATYSFANLFTYCAKGDSVSPPPTSEVVTGTYSQAGFDVTRITGARDFVVGDIGKIILFSGGQQAKISSITSVAIAVVEISQTVSPATTIKIFDVTLDELDSEVGTRTANYSQDSGDNSTTDLLNSRTLKRTFVFDAETETPESYAGDMSLAAGVVTYISGRAFSADDVGKTFRFGTSGNEYLIDGYSAPDLTIADTGPTEASGQAVTIYGYNTYSEFGFSHAPNAPTPDPNTINIRIVPALAINVNCPTSILPGEQIRVEYEMTIAVSPDTSTGGTAPITDAGNLMSSGAGAKDGDYVIERLDLSYINSNGSTSLSAAALEPSRPSYLGLTKDTAALVAVGTGTAPSRENGAAYVAMTNETPEFINGTGSVVSAGTFPVNSAIGSLWRSLCLFSQQSGAAAFTFLFDNPQTKTSPMGLIIRMKKTWSRTLS